MDKIFCGNGKNHWFTNEQGKKTGQNIRISVDLDKLESYFQAHGNTGKNNGVRYMSLEVTSNKDGVDKYENSHNVSINTFKPEPQGQQQGQGGHNVNGSIDPARTQQNNNNYQTYQPPAGPVNPVFDDESDIPF